MRVTRPLLVGMLAFSQISVAQNTPSSPAPRAEAKPAASISSVTQGMKKFDGYFPFYYDEKSGKIYLEVDKLGKEFLYFGSLTNGVGSGGPERGQASSAIAKFERVGTKVFLVEPVYSYRAMSKNADEQHAVENAFAKSVIWGFNPAAVEGDKVLLDMTPFLVRDSQKIGDRLGTPSYAGPGVGGGRAGGGGASTPYRFDESRSAVYLENTKNFPKNTEFEAIITFTGGPTGAGRGFFGGGSDIAPDPNAVTVNMHQSFVELPDDKYKPRKFDPRSGFNQFTYMDFSAPMTEQLTKRYTRRHRLEKKNPKAAMSEPVEPIVYYVDRGAPEQIKKALIEGGSWWNQAFEAAGYKNAFQVKELPAGADPMDIRYNVVNWVNRSGSPRAFSYGSSYIDPRTGEIIKGVVTLGSDRHRQDYLIAEGLLQPYHDGKQTTDKMEKMALARIRQLSAHEIGHTLGLYHNFTSSTHDRGSVMDYPFPRFELKNGVVDVSDAYATGIGSWDKRAITWGYQDFAKGTNEDEALDKIMAETLKQGHIFIPDIGGYVHPNSHQWDDGENAVVQLNKLMTVRRHVLDNFSEAAIQKDMPMATLEEVLVPIYLLHRYQIEATAKSLGGLYFTHAVKNDGQTITRMVDPAEQWKAFDALMATVSPQALALPEKLIQKIPPRPSGFPGGLETFSGYTGPTFDPMAAAESAANETISSLLNPERAARLVEYHARDAAQPGFLPVVDKLLDKTWKTPLAAGYNGELQAVVNNLTLKYLLALAANEKASPGVRGEALLKVDDLQQWMTATVAKAEPRQKANLLFGLDQIGKYRESPEKFLTPAASVMPPGAPIGMPAMDFLNDDFAY
ncbi:zinc-dependent metalloprotease [Hymenobacter sp. GOD-10R]|uniref:zinc-dependent metalloprotease n=1 Tax=Hymenobacter sp. GOD-10R TaxID=3093922 RepID=UPI002D77B2C2|nr:zinc-dependent metalloprotease [Hymenobacter sp. GOD-10R]WRQ30613.1 zinc-dependent metalloprotease [Hymenobacter sp. GOD-10R]